jgi:hypothetical protein
LHTPRVLPAVTVDTYNEELRDEEGFVGDRASVVAFRRHPRGLARQVAGAG